MNKLRIGKKYHTQNQIQDIDFDFKLLNIEKGHMAYEILENRSTNIAFGGKKGVNIAKYNERAEMVKNSKELQY